MIGEMWVYGGGGEEMHFPRSPWGMVFANAEGLAGDFRATKATHTCEFGMLYSLGCLYYV